MTLTCSCFNPHSSALDQPSTSHFPFPASANAPRASTDLILKVPYLGNADLEGGAFAHPQAARGPIGGQRAQRRGLEGPRAHAAGHVAPPRQDNEQEAPRTHGEAARHEVPRGLGRGAPPLHTTSTQKRGGESKSKHNTGGSLSACNGPATSEESRPISGVLAAIPLPPQARSSSILRPCHYCALSGGVRGQLELGAIPWRSLPRTLVLCRPDRWT